MKLYATVSSERAAKGQGGNTHLDIVLTGAGKAVVDRLCFTVSPQGGYDLWSGHGDAKPEFLLRHYKEPKG